jgi:alcohol dehydrogenase
MDAFIHALEAFLGLQANPFSDQLALAAMQTAYQYLPRAVADGEDLQAREKMMLAALWGGIAMDQAGLGLVHALSGPLSTYGHLHHGLTNALILPYVLRFNEPAITPARLQALKDLVGLKQDQDSDALFEAVRDFVDALNLPTTLSAVQISLDEQTRRSIASDTMQMVLIKNNPRLTTEPDCCVLLEQMQGS